jgi:HEAT repeat protein
MSLPTVHDPHSPNQPDPNLDPKVASLPDLPPVEAPSAGFVVQLFVIPAVVVAVVIVVWLLFGKLAGGERDATEYVRQLRLSSANWRSAYELASLIQNDARLANDPRLLGELADLLSSELDHDENTRLTVYLVKTLGAFQTLDASSADGRKIDPIEPLLKALEPRYDLAIRIEAAASLARQAARLQDKLDDPRAISALNRAASEGEPELRQVATYALGFFGGQDVLKALRERLQGDEDRFVRYNAAVALGRRGDRAAAETLREMLSSADLDRVIQLPSRTEKQHKIESLQLEALQAIQSSLSGGSAELARSLRPSIEGLTRSGLASVRMQAQAVLQNLPSAG